LIIPGAIHTDLYDGGGKNAIPFDKLQSFFEGNCSVHPRINVKFQKEKREVMSNNKP
jgi:hypothetical protein